MDECGEKNTISLSWGRREIRISGEGATLYVNGVPHDMTMMLETIRGAGARPERISPARWISLLRGRPTVLPGCESPLVMYGSLPDIRSGVCFRPGKRDTPSRRKCSNWTGLLIKYDINKVNSCKN